MKVGQARLNRIMSNTEILLPPVKKIILIVYDESGTAEVATSEDSPKQCIEILKKLIGKMETALNNLS